MSKACEQNDLLNRDLRWMLWGVPTVVLVVGAFLQPLPRALLWTPALTVAGISCLVNARGCGRLHCFITGPL